MRWDLPTSADVNGTEYEIRSDYRAILDICVALNDPELDEREKAQVALDIFYPAFETMPRRDYEEALKQCFFFIDGGEERNGTKAVKLVDWEQDYKFIISPINTAAGTDVRSLEYLHWWSFLSYYMDMGDCLFAQIVRIRQKKARGERLEKYEEKWYRENRAIVDIKTKYSSEEDELIRKWTEF